MLSLRQTGTGSIRLPPIQEAQADAAGLLVDKHVLVDGYNLELREGTGVKHYGLGLLGALHDLGARVSILRSCRRSRIPFVQEALLQAEAADRGSPLPYLPGAVQALLGIPRRAWPCLPAGNSIMPREEGELRRLHRLYVAPHCYRLANNLFRYTGVDLKVRIPDTVHVWHATYPLPIRFKKARTITTIHDLIPLKLPWATRDDKESYYRLVRHALTHSDLVVTDSESAKNDLVDIFGVDAARVTVLYPTAPWCPTEVAEETLAPKLGMYGLRAGRYLLFVGAVQPRKNLGRLCQALAALRARIPLVVVGPKGWLWQDELRYAEPLRRRRRLVWLRHVPRPHLQALYAGAQFLVFPSLYEGFGLPPLEAMAHGCPVLASNTSSLPEVCGDAAVYADPYDVDDLAEKVRCLLQDEPLRVRLRERGYERVARFGPARHREQVLRAYARVLA